MRIETGQSLLHYRLVEKIGEGGMGVVWRALDTTLDRDVAIKILPDSLSTNPERLSRFEREAKLLASLNHPGIASIFSVHSVDETRFLAMELIDGEVLSRLVPSGGLPFEDLLDIAIPLADALACAHTRGITHRDLKPDNVMITTERRVKVLDFGLAKLAPSGDTEDEQSALATASLTQAGRVMGTVAFMSPEQVEGRPLDSRSDVFSLGIVLYLMATGRLPFKGNSPVSTLSAILRDQPEPITDLRRSLPRRLDRIISRCLEKDPAKRYADGGEVRDDLAELKRGLEGGTLREPSGLSVTRKLALGLGATLVVLAALIGLWWLGSRPESPGIPRETGPPVAVIGFENLSDPSDEENLGRVLMGLITTDLAESGGLEVLSTARVLAAIKQAGGETGRAFDVGIASEAASISGAGIMLVGQVNRDDERILFAAELVDVESGRTTGSIRKEAASNSELFELADSIADEVRDLLGVRTPAGVSGFDIAKSLTDSPEAYRQFVAGELAFHEFDTGEAVEEFEKAIEIDPEFALAYYRLAMAYDWSGATEEALDTLHRGLPHVDRLPVHWRQMYRAAIDFNQRDLEKTHDRLTELIEAGASLPDAHYLLGETFTHSSWRWDPNRAREEFERALELDPTFERAATHLVELYALADDDDALRRMIERFEGGGGMAARAAKEQLLWSERRFEELVSGSTGGPSPATARLYSSLIHLGRLDEALEMSTGLISMEGTDVGFMLTIRASVFVAMGQFWKGIEDCQQAIEAQSTSPARSLTGSYVALARSLRLIDETASATAAARDAVEIDPYGGGGYYWLVRTLLDVDRIVDAERVLSTMTLLFRDSESPIASFWKEMLAAEILLFRSEPAEARAALKRAADRPPEYRDRTTEARLRARILEALGDRPGAIAAYVEVLDPPYLLASEQWSPWTDWPIQQIEVLYPLARLEQAEGRIEDARRHYAAYLERWGEADAPVVGVDDARKQLQILERD